MFLLIFRPLHGSFPGLKHLGSAVWAWQLRESWILQQCHNLPGISTWKSLLHFHYGEARKYQNNRLGISPLYFVCGFFDDSSNQVWRLRKWELFPVKKFRLPLYATYFFTHWFRRGNGSSRCQQVHHWLHNWRNKRFLLCVFLEFLHGIISFWKSPCSICAWIFRSEILCHHHHFNW